MVIYVGIDPGYTNLGTAILRGNRLRTQTIVLSGSLADRAFQIWYWITTADISRPRFIAIEYLDVGIKKLIVNLHTIPSVISVYAKMHDIPIGLIRPQVHKRYLAGPEKANYPDLYYENIQSILKKEGIKWLDEPLNPGWHDYDAVGILLTARDIQNKTHDGKFEIL